MFIVPVYKLIRINDGGIRYSSIIWRTKIKFLISDYVLVPVAEVDPRRYSVKKEFLKIPKKTPVAESLLQ